MVMMMMDCDGGEEGVQTNKEIGVKTQMEGG